jgi:hypothetical protein
MLPPQLREQALKIVADYSVRDDDPMWLIVALTVRAHAISSKAAKTVEQATKPAPRTKRAKTKPKPQVDRAEVAIKGLAPVIYATAFLVMVAVVGSGLTLLAMVK